MVRRSLLMYSGAANMDHMANCACHWLRANERGARGERAVRGRRSTAPAQRCRAAAACLVDIPKSPTRIMSGSFQAPGPAAGTIWV